MDIAALSMSMSASSLQQGVETAVIKKAMDFQESQAAALIKSMDSIPSFGHRLDVRV